MPLDWIYEAYQPITIQGHRIASHLNVSLDQIRTLNRTCLDFRPPFSRKRQHIRQLYHYHWIPFEIPCRRESKLKRDTQPEGFILINVK
jgi:hypothetical protein